MKVIGTRTVNLADLHANLFVRQALDMDHALYLGQLIEAGVQMKDPIEATEVNGLNEIVDGRHRKEGYELARVGQVKVKFLAFDSESEMIAYAYRANTGGSKPPTLADTEHTVMLLLERGESMKAIGELLGLPAALARKYANEVKSRMGRAKLQRAAAAVTEGGLTVSKAAEQYGVDPEKLKEVLSGRVRKTKSGVQEIRRNLSKLYNSSGIRQARMIKKMMEKYEDGDVTEKQMRDIFAHIDQLHKQAARSVADWKKRFEALNGKSKEAAA